MAEDGQTRWHIRGEEVGSCNCVWACPCQFEGDPSDGTCKALVGFEIREGHFGDVDLAGVRFAEIVSWPGPIYEGDGTVQLVVDESASAEQRGAIEQMASGTQGGAYFEIFSSVLPHVRDPITAPIEFETDRERRNASVRVGTVGELRIEPIRNPVSGDPHRVRIDLPDGFEYEQAEIGNTVGARVSGEAPLDFALEGTYGQLNPIDWTNA